MGNFNLNNYDEVKDRIKKFLSDHEDGRITTKILFQDGNRTMIKAFVYLNTGDQKDKLPKATGIAEEERILEKSISKKTGEEYEEVNYSSWTENCETSAIGRALANMGYSGDKRPSREEMGKVQRYSNAKTFTPTATTAPENGQSDVCYVCGEKVTEKVAEYSKGKFKKVLCFDCQKKV